MLLRQSEANAHEIRDEAAPHERACGVARGGRFDALGHCQRRAGHDGEHARNIGTEQEVRWTA
jgi:hypothetical protein